MSVATGGIAKLVENLIGRKFMHFGKPDTQMFTYAYNRLKRLMPVTKPDILMVGDNLHTDILGGNKFGVKTALGALRQHQRTQCGATDHVNRYHS